MTSIEFGKKCQPYNKQYKELFGYVPCRGDYRCNQDEYFEALLQAINTKQELSVLLPMYKIDYSNPNIKY